MNPETLYQYEVMQQLRGNKRNFDLVLQVILFKKDGGDLISRQDLERYQITQDYFEVEVENHP